MSRCILALDFDGVTHPDGCFEANFFCRLPLIEQVVREFPSVMFVISSNWRDHHSLDDLVKYFSPNLHARVIGTTPNLSTHPSYWRPNAIGWEYARQFEIEPWLEESGRWGDRWLALDDRPYWFEPGCRKLLVTNPSTGFMSADQETLHLMLKERVSGNDLHRL